MSGFDDMYARNKGRAVEDFKKAHDNIQPKELPEPVQKAMEYDKFQPRPRPRLGFHGAIADAVDRQLFAQNMTQEHERAKVEIERNNPGKECQNENEKDRGR